MNKQKFGLIIFWIGVLLAVIMGSFASWSVAETFRNLTMDEVNNTLWAIPGFWFFLWAFAVPFGALLAGIGVLIYTKTKTSSIWLSGIGIFLVITVMTFMPKDSHYPPLFGIGGILIMLSFFGILWLWAKKNANLNNKEKIPADLQLVGYIFLMIAMWFTCGEFGLLHQKAFEGDPQGSPIHIMVYLVLGWLFLFLSHYKSMKLKK